MNRLENNQDPTPEADLSDIKGRHSLRASVNQHCKDCIYDEHAKGEGSWRAQVEACTVTTCSLYPVRPVSKSKRVADLPSETE